MVPPLSQQEIDAWLRDHHAEHPHPSFGDVRKQRPTPSVNFESRTPGQVLGLAREALHWLVGGESRSTLLVIHEYGVWPSAELLSLFALVRGDASSYGLLESAPGQAFRPDEGDPLLHALWLSMCFGWGVRVHAEGTGRVVQTDHDGFLWRLEP